MAEIRPLGDALREVSTLFLADDLDLEFDRERDLERMSLTFLMISGDFLLLFLAELLFLGGDLDLDGLRLSILRVTLSLAKAFSVDRDLERLRLSLLPFLSNESRFRLSFLLYFCRCSLSRLSRGVIERSLLAGGGEFLTLFFLRGGERERLGENRLLGGKGDLDLDRLFLKLLPYP